MNCFAHALPWLGDPWMVAGTCLPDWLAVADRRLRIRERTARQWIGSTDRDLDRLAAGVVRHHQDDHWFHGGPEFQSLNIALSLELRDLQESTSSLQTNLAAHIVIEMLIDGRLDELHPGMLEEYYRQLDQIPAAQLASHVEAMTGRDAQAIALLFDRFRRERFLFDYARDEGVLYRLNRVLIRVGLPALPMPVLDWLPSVRQRVSASIGGLLAEYPVPLAAGAAV